MFCSNCGAKLRDGVQFCSSCGKKIADKPGNPAAGALGQPPLMRPQGQVPPQGQGMPPQRNGAPLQGQGMPPQRNGVPLQGQGMPPRRNGVPLQGQGVSPQINSAPSQGQAVQFQNQAAFEQNQMKREQAAAAAEAWDNAEISSDRDERPGRSWVMAAVIFILVLCGAGAGVLFYFISGIGEADPLKDSSGYESMESEGDKVPGEENTKEDVEAESLSGAGEGETSAAETTAAADTTAALEPVTFTVNRISQVNLSGKVRAVMLRDTAVASSYIVQSDATIDNSAWSAFDGDNVTSWQEGVEGDGRGEYVGVSFDREYQVEAVTFVLGNHRRDDLYIRNNVPRTLAINLDGQVFEVTFPKEMLEQVVVFSRPVPASSIRVTIQDVYPGTEYTDTVIAEIGVYGQ